MIERPVFPPEMRKCPRHKAWIQKVPNGGTRYCPRCDIEYAQALHKMRMDHDMPAEQPKLKIIKL